MSFVIWAIILAVKRDADFRNDTSKRIFQRLGVVLMDFNVTGVVLRKIFLLSPRVMFGIFLGVQRHPDYEYPIAG